MKSNIEIKLIATNLQVVADRIIAIGGKFIQTFEQQDTYFTVPKGRLKLRKQSATSGELIYYERPNVAGMRQSQYIVAKTAEPDALLEALTAVLPVPGVVKKTRHLYLVGQTRIHLDTVSQLGTFIELEVVLEPNQTADQGAKIADTLMDKLYIASARRVPGSYLDLLVAKTIAKSPPA